MLKLARVIGILEPGGAQLSALRLSAALRSHGIESRLYAGDATPAGLALAADFGVEVEAFAHDQHLQWVPSEEFAPWLRPRLADADLVHAHMFGAWWAAASVIPDGRPLIASEHNAVRWPYGDHSATAAEAIRRVDAFFAHGPAAREFALSLGIDPGRLYEGRSAVDGLDAKPAPGLARPLVTFVGRLHEEKGPDILLEALALMANPPEAIFVGEGPLRSRLTQRAVELRLSDRVRLPGWSRSPGDYIAGATVHVVPSREEAWSQSAVVGLGLGVPVVGSAVEGLPTTLGEGRGVLVAPESPRALAYALADVLAGRGVPHPEPGRRYAARFAPAPVAAYYADTYAGLVA